MEAEKVNWKQRDPNLPRRLNTSTLPILAWARGYKGVTGLAQAVGKHRVTVWRAVARPDQFGPTFRALETLLL